MSDVAKRELCEELFELSGWNDTKLDWHRSDLTEFGREVAPAYDLGFLIRKLPHIKDIDFRVEQNGESEEGYDWVAYGIDYTKHPLDESSRWWSNADTPENALALLCIELFKQGILKGKEKNE